MVEVKGSNWFTNTAKFEVKSCNSPRTTAYDNIEAFQKRMKNLGKRGEKINFVYLRKGVFTVYTTMNPEEVAYHNPCGPQQYQHMTDKKIINYSTTRKIVTDSAISYKGENYYRFHYE